MWLTGNWLVVRIGSDRFHLLKGLEHTLCVAATRKQVGGVALGTTPPFSFRGYISFTWVPATSWGWKPQKLADKRIY